MEELELAIEYLKRRSVETKNVNNVLIRNFGKVVSASEVEAVLNMVQHGEFTRWYETMKKEGHPDFI
jgi:hypothetical protein